MIKWILIAYLTSGSGTSSTGGPMTAEFETLKACQEAVEVMKIMHRFAAPDEIGDPKEKRWWAEWARCVPNQ